MIAQNTSSAEETRLIKYPSKLPQRTYPTTLKEQLVELETDELVVRYAESRQQLSSDRYRPVYHYVPPEGPTNDPNGFCTWQGRYHLCYQQYPPEDRRQHWGHAVSEDLVYWKDLPTAIFPGIEEKCYSGGALTEDDRVLACYHGTDALGARPSSTPAPLDPTGSMRLNRPYGSAKPR